MGKAHSNQAQVLLTTKAQLSLRSRGKSFSDIKEFWYMGRPRQVRWVDESFMEGRPLTLTRTTIGIFLTCIDKHSDLLRQVEGILEAPKGVDDGQVFQVPELCVPWVRARELRIPAESDQRLRFKSTARSD